jgi:hypothetical protein
MVVAVVLAITGLLLLVRHSRPDVHQHLTASCANHAIQLKFLVMAFVETQQHFPSESDARTAFSRMNHSGQWPSNWLSSYGSSCPESFKRNESIGYVFVADGLSTKAAVEHGALVFFCPADSHQGLEQHCHAMFADGLRCLKSNGEMIEVLRTELGRVRAGSVTYSTNAQELMERELAARENYARKQEH